MTEKNTPIKIKIIITTLVSFIPELFLSWVIGGIIDTSLWYVWIGLQAIKFFLWLIRSVIGYLLFHLIWKNEIIDSMYSSLVQRKYPNPTKYATTYFSDGSVAITASEYFSAVMTDNELEWNTRIDAAQTHGALVNTEGFLHAMRKERIAMKAIDKFHKINFSGKNYEENQGG